MKMTKQDGVVTLNDQERVRLASRAYESEEILNSLKKELEELTALFQDKRNRDLSARLCAENDVLRQQVAASKDELLKLEIQHKVPQIARPTFPRAPGTCLISTSVPPVTEKKSKAEQPSNDIAVEKAPKTPKAPKAPKSDQPKKAGDNDKSGKPGAKPEAPIDVGRLDLRVGFIRSAKKHPDADALYVEEVDVGEEQPRTVVSGLVKFVPLEEMQQRKVVVLCNLKPVKMRGVTSQAMVMCASTPEKVEILEPPTGSVPGDEIHVEGYPRNPDAVLNPKHKIFETVAPDLKTNADKVATFKGISWCVPGKGTVKTQSLINVQIK